MLCRQGGAERPSRTANTRAWLPPPHCPHSWRYIGVCAGEGPHAQMRASHRALSKNCPSVAGNRVALRCPAGLAPLATRLHEAPRSRHETIYNRSGNRAGSTPAPSHRRTTPGDADPRGTLGQQLFQKLRWAAQFERPTRGDSGAGDRARTDDILLGQQTLCQLSYTRVIPAGGPFKDPSPVGVILPCLDAMCKEPRPAISRSRVPLASGCPAISARSAPHPPVG